MISSRFIGAALLLLLPLLTGACGDNPADPVEEDHFEVRGLVLVRAGIDSVVADSGRIVRGSLAVGAGDTTGSFDIYFIREDNGAHDLPVDEGFTLRLAIADTTLAAAVVPPADGHTHAHWEFRLAGRRAGATSIQVQILHEGHLDFTSPPIPLTVTQ